MKIINTINPSFRIVNRKKSILGGLITLTVTKFVLNKWWTVRFHNNGRTFGLKVPQGFECDLASIPRIIWWLISAHELGSAPILHDYLYHRKGYVTLTERFKDNHVNIIDQPLTRKETDDLWSALMREQNVGPYQRFVSYWAVRLFGWTYWRW